MVRKIVENIPDDVLQQDLEIYRQRAIELGATDAKIITTDMIVIDERVRAKCTWPRCSEYGTNANCPPHVMEVEQIRKIVNKFRHAIFTRLQVPSEEFAGIEANKNMLWMRAEIKNHEIVSKLEAEAFYDGYYLAVGFGSGTCKSLCIDKECSALIPGQACRHYYRARSSMEGAGMDAFIMATRVGWEVYPIGVPTPPSAVPCAISLGLVLIY